MGRFARHSGLLIGLSAILLSLPTAVVAQSLSGVLRAAAAASVPPNSALAITATSMDISAVTALSPTNAWAVGSYCAFGCAGGNAVERMLLIHWNGTAWAKVASPAQTAGVGYELTGVAGDRSADVWATGLWYNNNLGTVGPVILHWNGTAWSEVPSPNPGAYGNQLSAVTAVSPTNAWAVGIHYTSTGQGTLILRWDGATWSRVAGPNPGSGSTLTSVGADSATDAWATGSYPSAQKQATLALRWNGTAWSKAATPSPGGTINELDAVTALSATNAWAAGDYCLSSACRGYPPRDTLILHWNGTAWSKAASPDPGFGNHLAGLTATSATDAWAVGDFYGSASTNTRTLILHWNGTAWSKATSPNPSTSSNDLTSVSADSSTDAWATGTYCASACTSGTPVNGLLALHWNGSTWSAK